MIKKMSIEIPIDTEKDTTEQVNDVMNNVIEICNDSFFAVSKVTLDGEILFELGSGFNRTSLKKKG